MTTPISKITDLRRKPPAAQAAPRPKPGGDKVIQGPPLPMGPITKLTSAEKAVFDNLGIKPGPMPPDMADKINEVLEEVRIKDPDFFKPMWPAGFDPDKHRLPPVKNIDFSQLPANKRREIMQFVEQYRTSLNDRKAMSELMPSASRDPSIGQAIQDGMRGEDGRTQLYLEETVAESSAPPPRPRQSTARPAPDATRKMSPQPTAERDESGVDLEPKVCKHCGWKYGDADDLEITEHESLTYQAAMITGDRIRQEIVLLEGKMRIGFRSLLSREADMALAQAMTDASKVTSVISMGDELRMRLLSYRLVLGLEYIETSGTGRREVPALEEAELDSPEPGDLPVKKFCEAITELFLSGEQLRRVVHDAFNIFSLKLDKLDKQAWDPKGHRPASA